jgi:hypothetical protein
VFFLSGSIFVCCLIKHQLYPVTVNENVGRYREDFKKCSNFESNLRKLGKRNLIFIRHHTLQMYRILLKFKSHHVSCCVELT